MRALFIHNHPPYGSERTSSSGLSSVQTSNRTGLDVSKQTHIGLTVRTATGRVRAAVGGEAGREARCQLFVTRLREEQGLD